MTLSRVRTVKARNPLPTEALGRPRKRRGLQGRGFSACLCPKTILVELRGGKVLRRDWGGLPAPRQRQGGRGSLFVPPQTATKPPRKPHKPRKAAGGTATRGREKSRVLRVLCAFCASYGALAAGGVRLRKPPHEKFARSPCHHTAVSAPIAPASVCGAMGFYGALAYFLQRVSFPFVRKTNLPAFPASFSPLEGV